VHQHPVVDPSQGDVEVGRGVPDRVRCQLGHHESSLVEQAGETMLDEALRHEAPAAR
jgi:hypothetical protein